MIDWSLVARHALWISGAAIVLAAWSFGRTEGYTANARALIALGALLFCIGFALVTPLWLAIGWAALAVLAAAQLWRVSPWHRHRH